jgi:hypothetical protein
MSGEAIKHFRISPAKYQEISHVVALCGPVYVRSAGIDDAYTQLFRRTGGGLSSEPGVVPKPELLRRLDGGITFGVLDAAEAGLLPDDYQNQFRALHEKFTKVKPFKSFDSEIIRDVSDREMGRVVGEVIKNQMPWFDTLYHGTFLRWARILTGNPHLATADEIVKSDPENKDLTAEELKKKIAEKSFVLNAVSGRKQQLIGHVDTNAVSGIFFPEDYNGPDGGTIFSGDPGASTTEEIMATRIMEFVPRAGKMLYVAATQLPHFVESVPDGFLRLSVACNFFDPRFDRKRPDALEENR